MNEQELRVLLITAALSGLAGHMVQHKNAAQLAEYALETAEHTLQQMKIKGLVVFVKTTHAEGNNVPKGANVNG